MFEFAVSSATCIIWFNSLWLVQIWFNLMSIKGISVYLIMFCFCLLRIRNLSTKNTKKGHDISFSGNLLFLFKQKCILMNLFQNFDKHKRGKTIDIKFKKEVRLHKFVRIFFFRFCRAYYFMMDVFKSLYRDGFNYNKTSYFHMQAQTGHQTPSRFLCTLQKLAHTLFDSRHNKSWLSGCNHKFLDLVTHALFFPGST